MKPYQSANVAAAGLRIFLGGTMLYAAADKLFLDARFLRSEGAGSIGDTLRFFATSGGPLAALVEAVALPQPVLIGAMMAGAQLIVAVSLLSGSWVRLGALLGAAISLMLALTASWGISPYYYGNDLPYLVGFLVLAALGGGSSLHLGAPTQRRFDPERRAALVSGTGVLAAMAALLLLDRSRAMTVITGEGTPSPSPTPAASASPSASPTSSATPSPSGTPKPTATPRPTATPTASPTPTGVVIEGAPSLGAGQALNFTVNSANDSVLVNDGGTYRAFERSCTHAGGLVNWQEGSGLFECPLHFARFAADGTATLAPATMPLRPIEISVAPDGTVTYRR